MILRILFSNTLKMTTTLKIGDMNHSSEKIHTAQLKMKFFLELAVTMSTVAPCLAIRASISATAAAAGALERVTATPPNPRFPVVCP